MTSTSSDALAAMRPLDAAATLFDAIARHPAHVPSDCLLACLLAAEHLETAGATVLPIEPPVDDPATTIRAAMTWLAELDDASFGSDSVLDAARAARRALRAVT